MGRKAIHQMASRIWRGAASLASDSSGNVLPIVAAAIIPVLALIGGGIDMGRSYLSETRLQQACDAGVLAARKHLGTSVVVTGEVPAAAADAGNSFFNLNYRNGAYGTENRTFEMTLTDDYSVSGVATVGVPTTIMRIFGYTEVPVQVTCEARLNFSNTDIMMVLDTTGSMSITNPDDDEPRINVLRQTVKDFHQQVTDSAADGTTIRFGFVPYATNVNVGFSLKSDWMVDEWTYQSREAIPTGTSTTYNTYTVVYEVLNGSVTYIAEYTSPTCPADTRLTNYDPSVEISSSPHSFYQISHSTGVDYHCVAYDGQFKVTGTSYNNYDEKATWTYYGTVTYPNYTYEYKPIEYNVTAMKGATGDDPTQWGKVDAPLHNPGNGSVTTWEAWYGGCIEERGTYEIDDYSNIDFAQAIDLDIDRIPDPADETTQWRPQIPDLIFDREINWDGSGGDFTVAPVTYPGSFFAPSWYQAAICPSEARKLAVMAPEDVADYVDTLTIGGNTYHDIGMIWGGRFISPTGIFAAENTPAAGTAISRHLIFLTDGQTETYDISYGTYGVDGLDRRRWNPDAPLGNLSLDQVVENRFAAACTQVKNKNVTVWVIGFGTEMTDLMKQCAGDGHWFQADSAEELTNVFDAIAASMGDLRISK